LPCATRRLVLDAMVHRVAQQVCDGSTIRCSSCASTASALR
jgi:hypothetical protein